MLAAFSRSIGFVAEPITADVVHCHTWYAHLGGILAKLAYGIPLVITVHSLEPLRPWKREQLGGGYDASSWVERTALEMADAVIAVSQGTKDDVLATSTSPEERIAIIHNGIDPDEYRAAGGNRRAGSGTGSTRPCRTSLFVGRITRQKGIVHLVPRDPPPRAGDRGRALRRRARHAGDRRRDGGGRGARHRRVNPNVHWIAEMVDKPTVRQLYSHAAVFCCPSVYEPFGIINLEAMACETAVVASAVGGIPEVVVEGETGLLVPFEPAGGGSFEPSDPDAFERDLAARINELMADEPRRRAMGVAGRRRAVDHFGWAVDRAPDGGPRTSR